MSRYLLRRLLITAPSLIGISIVLFTVLALAPGDPFGELATNPLAAETSHVLADAAEDGGQEHRSKLLHASRLAIFELLRGRALTDPECRDILAAPAQQEQHISRALGAPDAETMLPDLLTPAGVRSQYDFQRLLLASLDLLEDHHGHLGVTGIDGSSHPLPAVEMIRQRLASVPNVLVAGFLQVRPRQIVKVAITK